MRKRQAFNSKKLQLTVSTSNMRYPTQVLKDTLGETSPQEVFESEVVVSDENLKGKYVCCSRMKHVLVWIIIFGALSTVLLRSAIPIHFNVADEKFLEIRKCPACFGVCLCPAFLTGEIVPETWSRFRASLLFNTKNVYFASYKGKHVVLKKLGHDSELESLDHHILHQSMNLLNNPIGQVSVSMAVRPYTQQNVQLDYVSDLQGNGSHLVHRLRLFDPSPKNPSNDLKEGSQSSQKSDLLVCPSQRKLSYVENEFVKNNFGLYRLTCLYNMMTLLLLNSEPLVFQAFPAEKGWPFPKYYGACGRVIVEEYVGQNLAQWLPLASWKEKLRAALELLKISVQFTEGVSGFRLYATDLSLYNIAVGLDGSLRIIDGENIIVVDLDKIQKDRPDNFDIPYASDNAGCEELPSDLHCMSYSEKDLCNRLNNDHNYFAVCRELFSPPDNFGLRNSLPEAVLKHFPFVPKIQKDCYDSSTPNVRENAAKQLISAYTEILAGF